VTHYFSLSEIADAFSVTVYSLYKDFYQPHIALRYHKSMCIYHGGDSAGWRASSSSKDKRGDMKILAQEFHLPFRYKYLSLNSSLQYMRSLLSPSYPCRCGRELIQIDKTGCPVLIAALEGGYKYSKSRQGHLSDRPVEDRYFADVACAWRYGAESYVRFGLPSQGASEHSLDDPGARQGHFTGFGAQLSPLEWLNKTDAQLAALLKG